MRIGDWGVIFFITKRINIYGGNEIVDKYIKSLYICNEEKLREK